MELLRGRRRSEGRSVGKPPSRSQEQEGRLRGVLGVSWAILEASWGGLGLTHNKQRQCHLGGSWRPLGGLLGRLGGFLGPLGGQDPPEARGPRVLRPQKTHVGLTLGRFLDGFWNRFSILFLPYPTRRQHVVKPQNYYICSTGEPFEALHVEYF